MKETVRVNAPQGSLRQRVLTSVGAMVVLSLLGSAFSLYRITEVNRLLEAMNQVYIPLGRLFTQIQSDAEIFHRELERSLGYAHWNEASWKPRAVPRWIQEVLTHEMGRVSELIKSESQWATPEVQARWDEWAADILQKLETINGEAAQLFSALEHKDEALAHEIYPRWTASLEAWKKQLQWGVAEYERSLRLNFSATENRVSDLRTNLEMIFVIVVLLSLLVLWLGEGALRPLGELTLLAREITRRGLRKEDKALLPEMPLSRSDEVSQLAREFHRMATALLEREVTVENQKSRLQEQNRMLRDMGELNQNILNSIDSVLIVTDLAGFVTKCNPGAVQWLEITESQMIGSRLCQWPKLQALGFGSYTSHQSEGPRRIDPITVTTRIYGGWLMPLKGEQGESHGAILVLDDLTDEIDLQERLRQAENLAAVGRMSAQVAHEVRNPLHSIGLEAEIAADMAAKLGNASLKIALHSILSSVDRLQKITENYLKLTRLSDGQRSHMNLKEVLDSVMATYAPVTEAQGVDVQVLIEQNASLELWADRDLMEQVLGNLLRNALQALEGSRNTVHPRVCWRVGNAENGQLWLRIEDNGSGVSESIKNRLFKPFVTSRAQGTGLGLSFVKKVLEDHQGSIRYVDALPSLGGEQGAVFELILPLFHREEEGAIHAEMDLQDFIQKEVSLHVENSIGR